MRILVKIIALIVLIFSSLVLYDRFDIRQPVAFEALQQIDPLPHTKTLLAQKRVLEAQEYLHFFMQFDYMKNDKDAQKLLQEIETKRASLGYQTDKIISGILTGKSDELSGQISAGLSDFFLFGDLRDLSIEGYHHLSHQEVDTTLVALSSIGVVASATTVISMGSSTPIKGSLSFLKLAKKSGNLPKWLGKSIVKEAKVANKTKNLQQIKTLFNTTYQLIQYAGVRGGLKLLKNTDNPAKLKQAVNFAKTYGKNSAILSSIVGKDLLKYSKNVDKKAFLYAATYGKSGVKRIAKLGEKGFLKSLVKPVKTSRLVKIFDKNSLHLLKQIPDSIFYLLGLISIMILT